MMTIKRIALCVGLLATTFGTTGRAQQPPPAPPKLTTFRVDVSLTRLQGTKELGTSPYSLLLAYPSNNRSASLRIGVDVPTGTVTNAGSGRTETAFKTVGTQIDAYVSPFDDTRYAVDISINDTAVLNDSTGTDRVSEVELDRLGAAEQAAARALARQQELFDKKLATKESLNQAELKFKNVKADAAAGRSSVMKQQRAPLSRADQMAFRSFTSSNRVYLHDGETQEMTVATDRTSGETVRASVKLTIVK